MDSPTNVPPSQLAFEPNSLTRGTLDIVFSCLAVIIFSVHVAWHHDVHKLSFSHRTIAILAGLIFPEYILAKACQQFLVCIHWKRCLNELRDGRRRDAYIIPQSTVFFLLGGGMFSSKKLPLWPYIIAARHFELQDLERVIKDKSKADDLIKVITIAQAAWLVMQVIARAIQHLPITPLELTSLAYVLCALCAYIFWWNKPYNIEVPVYLDHRAIPKTTREKARDRQRRYARRASRQARAMEIDSPWVKVEPSTSNFWSQSAPELNSGTWRVSSTRLADLRRDSPEQYIFNSYTAYRTFTLYGKRKFVCSDLAIILVPSLTIFGGIHCIAWEFDFPTFIEKALWKVSSVAAVVLGPIIAWISQYFLQPDLHTQFDIHPITKDHLYGPKREIHFSYSKSMLTNLGGFLIVLIYTSARLVLMGIAFSSLRFQPRDTYILPQWTTFIPHFH